MFLFIPYILSTSGWSYTLNPIGNPCTIEGICIFLNHGVLGSLDVLKLLFLLSCEGLEDRDGLRVLINLRHIDKPKICQRIHCENPPVQDLGLAAKRAP